GRSPLLRCDLGVARRLRIRCDGLLLPELLNFLRQPSYLISEIHFALANRRRRGQRSICWFGINRSGIWVIRRPPIPIYCRWPNIRRVVTPYGRDDDRAREPAKGVRKPSEEERPTAKWRRHGRTNERRHGISVNWHHRVTEERGPWCTPHSRCVTKDGNTTATSAALRGQSSSHRSKDYKESGQSDGK